MINVVTNKIIFASQEDKKKSIRVLIDMDGVIVNWTKGACRTCGIDVDDPQIREKLKKSNGRLDEFLPDEEMWKKIDAEGMKWWEDLEKLPWANRLWDEMNEISQMVYILSSPSEYGICAGGKVEWIKKHFKPKGYNTKAYNLSPSKECCAMPNAILIDDTPKQINKFKEYGGNAFHWPDPFSILDGDVDIDEVFYNLKKKIQEIRNAQ